MIRHGRPLIDHVASRLRHDSPFHEWELAREELMKDGLFAEEAHGGYYRTGMNLEKHALRHRDGRVEVVPMVTWQIELDGFLVEVKAATVEEARDLGAAKLCDGVILTECASPVMTVSPVGGFVAEMRVTYVDEHCARWEYEAQRFVWRASTK